MTLSCIFVIILLGASQPMNFALDRRLEYFNETTILACVYHMFIFTEFADNPIARYLMGYSLIFFALINIVINIIIMIRATY